jgi:hypothetical protein
MSTTQMNSQALFNKTFSQPSHRIFEKSAGTICLALPHGRDE